MGRGPVTVFVGIIVVVVLAFAFWMQDAGAEDYRYPQDIDITLIHSDDENQYGGIAEGGAGGLAMRAEARDKMRQWVDHWERHDQGPTFDA